jgi:hypothetical protein
VLLEYQKRKKWLVPMWISYGPNLSIKKGVTNLSPCRYKNAQYRQFAFIHGKIYIYIYIYFCGFRISFQFTACICLWEPKAVVNPRVSRGGYLY